ncbi:hypothetical protein G4974_09985 [[Ruminococcus] gnavus]|uniref:DNA (cytosine-5-)-methyltransferase n=1 Tax=Mediterraneibacter gnavus TaxID=33038 RepID=A0AAJ1B0F1_MEDGN|nr:DNA cytosine methyltransferase [Mediterraneibacter gnavus]MCC3677278.1 DNA cytosine methyltransferase [[Clostridium] nexile]MCB5494522.1 DNA cytosine methyltransferase [Mediterraneibacter gnavus]MCB5593706.1 DNA cytosine methyltransferase [Mediterraneibacter gnavus]MCB5606440.1 DNA cytosine methyltransferase [Mediterraneibacter gnavus]MCG4523587.1 DNA cytosine methyltransferase [Mediterraneibacter gnavus]
MNRITVLSLFDGISCGQLALKRAGIKVEKYYASEIKKIAIKVTMEHFPDTVQIGDIEKVRYNRETKELITENGVYQTEGIDLVIGGSPCQNFSIARVSMGTKEIEGLKGDKSKLFYEYLRILREVQPKYFLLENVKMKKASENELNQYMGVNGLHINSELVTFAKRPRIYWTNIQGVKAPEDKKINFQDFKDTDPEYCKDFKVKRTPSRERMWNSGKGRETESNCENITNAEKIGCITRKQDRCPNSGLIEFEDFCRYLTRREIELAQTLPIGYTDSLTYNQMQDVCGDGWTVDVITHILRYAKETLN